MTLLELVIYGLATYRLTRLITRDVICEPFRNWLWKKLPPDRSRLGYLFTCEWCMSIYVASLLLASSMITSATDIAATLLALSAIAGLLTAYEDK
jgi:hypothetical protein